ncbi:hypothetical protein [Shimia sp.]|uniref:hypothetical protein n=1 Tax=Shimia sp. TaxID=1954381 RepID=UPI003B8AC258
MSIKSLQDGDNFKVLGQTSRRSLSRELFQLFNLSKRERLDILKSEIEEESETIDGEVLDASECLGPNVVYFPGGRPDDQEQDE